MDYLSQKEIPFGKILSDGNDFILLYFLKAAKFRYLLIKILVQNNFPFGARGNGSNVSFFFYDSLSDAQVVTWLRRRLPDPEVESLIPSYCTSEHIFFGFFHKFNILRSARTTLIKRYLSSKRDSLDPRGK